MSWNKIARDSQKKIHRFPQTNLPNDFLNRPWNSSARSRIRQGHRRTAGLSEENYKKMRTCAHGDSGRRRRALFSQRSVMPQWAKLLQDAGTVAEINALPFQRMFTGLHSIHSGCFVASPFSLSLSLSLSLVACGCLLSRWKARRREKARRNCRRREAARLFSPPLRDFRTFSSASLQGLPFLRITHLSWLIRLLADNDADRVSFNAGAATISRWEFQSPRFIPNVHYSRLHVSFERLGYFLDISFRRWNSEVRVDFDRVFKNDETFLTSWLFESVVTLTVNFVFISRKNARSFLCMGVVWNLMLIGNSWDIPFKFRQDEN